MSKICNKKVDIQDRGKEVLLIAKVIEDTFKEKKIFATRVEKVFVTKMALSLFGFPSEIVFGSRNGSFKPWLIVSEAHFHLDFFLTTENGVINLSRPTKTQFNGYRIVKDENYIRKNFFNLKSRFLNKTHYDVLSSSVKQLDKSLTRIETYHEFFKKHDIKINKVKVDGEDKYSLVHRKNNKIVKLVVWNDIYTMENYSHEQDLLYSFFVGAEFIPFEAEYGKCRNYYLFGFLKIPFFKKIIPFETLSKIPNKSESTIKNELSIYKKEHLCRKRKLK